MSSKAAIVYRCLVISPSDVAEARNSVAGAIVDWNAHVGPVLNCRVEPVRWEVSARPELGDSVQTVLNEAIVDQADFAIALFWTRAGTPTENHVSGSAEEVERLVASGRRVMVYFCAADPPASLVDREQLQRLARLRAAYEARGPLSTFHTLDELERLVHSHLTSLVAELTALQTAPASGHRQRQLVSRFTNIADRITRYVLSARNLATAFELSGEAALDADVEADAVLRHAIEAYNAAYEGLHTRRESYVRYLAEAADDGVLADDFRDLLATLDEAHRRGPFSFNKTYRCSVELRSLRRRLSVESERGAIEAEIRLVKATALESIRNAVADTESSLRSLERRADGLARKVRRT